MTDPSYTEQFERGCVTDFEEILIKMGRSMWEFENADAA